MKKLIFTVVFIGLLMLPLEVASRAYWMTSKHLSFWTPEAMDLFYPSLKSIRETKITRSDGYFDILLLGGSVLNDAGKWPEAIQHIQQQLSPITHGQPIRIHNAARPSHSSRDSFFKYRSYQDKHFDLVILYDSINEVRANNCPPKMFRSDYSHYSWYAKLNFFEHYPFFKILTLPYTLYSLAIDIQEKQKFILFIPTDIPNEDWVKYGNEIKSAESFRKNIATILDLAQKKQEPVLLSTFAFYVPRDYTYLKFRTHQLDYAAHTFYIEVWGKPEHVIKGILIHNRILGELANNHPEVIFLNESPLMPPGKTYYNDICHLTDQGLARLWDDFCKRILQSRD